jgi:hypothetical protein
MIVRRIDEIADACPMCGWDGDPCRERSKEEVIHLINYHRA